jgi:hypothetical protein
VRLLFVAGLVVTGLCAYYLGAPFADTYTYLEPGRNLLAGRGFITRFNVVYGWSGRLDHPALAYYNPLYGLLLAIVWWLIPNPALFSVIATAMPCSLNAVLLALLVRRAFGPLAALLSGAGYLLIPATWFNLYLTSAEHLAITIVLLCLLIVEYYVPRNGRGWFWVGVLLGVGYLVKVSLLLGVPGLLAAVAMTQQGNLRERICGSARAASRFGLGMALVVLPYTVFCRVTVGESYPSYPRMAETWSLATTYGGEYTADSPAVHPDLASLPGVAGRARIVIGNVQSLFEQSAAQLGLLALVMIIGLIDGEEPTRRLALFLTSTGASFALGHAAAFNWMPISKEPRYAIYAGALWYPVGVYGLMRLVDRGVAWHPLRNRIIVGLWCVASLPAVLEHISTLQRITPSFQPRSIQMRSIMRPLAELAGPDDLVAVESGGRLLSAAIFLDRPVVPLPQGEMNRTKAIWQFIEVYRPALVIPGRNYNAIQVLLKLKMRYEAKEIKELTESEELKGYPFKGYVFVRRPETAAPD